MFIIEFLVTGITVFILLFTIVGWAISSKGYKGPKSDHFDGKKFINSSGVSANGLLGVVKYLMTRNPEPWKKNYETYVRDFAIIAPQASQVQYTFVNHSTFLIQYDGLNILTDPVWSYRCSPVKHLGPARFRPPGVSYGDLPKIDIILMSHNHYDHLDKPTILKLIKDHNPIFVCPLGLDHLLSKWGATQIHVFDWWDEKLIGNLKITATPANHFTSRGTFDRDQTLWTGYILNHNGHKTYFVGDTGYGEIFKEIGKKEGPIDICLIPIGAYLPRWFMSPIHVSPNEAALIHHDVQSKQSIGMHFGTFALADDGPDRPAIDLMNAKEKHNIPDDRFIVPEEGFSYLFYK